MDDNTIRHFLQLQQELSQQDYQPDKCFHLKACIATITLKLKAAP